MMPTHPLTSLLLAAVLPQDPTHGATDRTAPPPVPVVAHAHAFPDTTLACVSVTATRAQLQTLQQIPVVSALLADLTERGLGTTRLDASVQAATNLPLARWIGLLHHGVTFGWTSVGDDGQARWLAVADAQDQAAAFALALDRLRQAPGVTALAAEDGTARTWTLSFAGGRAAFAIDDNKIVAGDSAGTVSEALARLRAVNPARSLASTPGFVEFELAASVQSDRLLSAWIRPSMVAERLVTGRQGTAEMARVQGVLRALDLTRVTGVGLTLARDGKNLVETFHLDWPAPRNGPLAELLAPRATLRPEAAALVPQDVDSFSASAVDLQRVFHTGMRLISEVAPAGERMVQAQITQLGEAVGVNLQDELLGKIGTQVLTLSWGSADAVPSTAFIVQVTDAAQFERALRRAVAGVAGAHEQSVNGYRVLVFDDDDGTQVSVTVTEDSLVVATSATALQRTLEQMATPRGTEPAVQIPAGVCAYGVTKLGPMLAQMENVLTMAQTRVGGTLDAGVLAGGLSAIQRAIAPESTMTTSASRDERTVTLEIRSPFGGITGTAAIVGSLVAVPALQAVRVDTALAAPRADGVPALLARVTAAEEAFQAEHAGQASGGLSALLATGTLTEAELGTPVNEQIFESAGYRLTILRGDPARPSEFIALAWPAGARTGPVFAAMTEHRALVNDVMAQAAGLTEVELDDVFTGGFGSPMRSGWRVDTAEPTANPTTAATTTATPGSGRLPAAVATLETKEGDVRAAREVLRTTLASSDPGAVAYAAHACGRLKLTEEVPALVNLASKHPDLGVRTQAMWALLQIGDPRSKQASIDALASESVELRALAAANLGKLRAQGTTPALLGLLPKGDDAGNDERDRAMALLALADIGDPAPLLQAAAAVPTGNAQTVQALTFAFQTLSPKLAAQAEAQLLVAVLDHPQTLLRRYAIQRLGELRDPTTARALEARLAAEGRELQPLLQVSLQAMQRTAGGDATSPSVTETLSTFLQRARSAWERSTLNHRLAGAGVGVALIVAVLLAGVLRRRARARAQGEAWAAMAASAPQLASPDELDLHIGESGVYTADEYAGDELLQQQEQADDELVAPRR